MSFGPFFFSWRRVIEETASVPKAFLVGWLLGWLRPPSLILALIRLPLIFTCAISDLLYFFLCCFFFFAYRLFFFFLSVLFYS